MEKEKKPEMDNSRYIDNYYLHGLDYQSPKVGTKVAELAEHFIQITLQQQSSYSEACRAFEIAKTGLETLKLTRH